MVKNTGKIKEIILQNIEEYKKHNKLRPVEIENIKKVLACRTFLYGEHLYKCINCGNELMVPHSCKSRFCSVCGYKATEDWINNRFTFLLDCSYHHVVVTLPAFIRGIVLSDRTIVLNMFSKLAAETIQEWASKRGYKVGMISFFHSFGNEIQFHPHFHFVVTAGGIKKDGSWYYTDVEIPGHILMPIFKAKFIAGLKELFNSGKIQTNRNKGQLFYQLNHQYEKHWQFYTDRITNKNTSTFMYVVRYAKKMIISDKRIISYNDKKVTYLNGKKEVRVCDIESFMKKLFKNIPPKYFRLIRYYGIYSNKSGKYYEQAKKYWPTFKTYVYRITWKDRQRAKNNKDPMKCSKCNAGMLLVKVRYPIKWYLLSFEKLKITNNIALQMKMKVSYG